jgi:hypothetical protein
MKNEIDGYMEKNPLLFSLSPPSPPKKRPAKKKRRNYTTRMKNCNK